MVPPSKPLLALTTADLMSRASVVIPQTMTLQGAAHLLAQADVSGAPVVDADGHCIGVISARDFVAWADRGPRPPRAAAGPCFCSSWSILAADASAQELVRDYMTADPVTVAPGTTLGPLAAAMLDAHIHRVIVVDATRRPVGVVSSTDVLAAVARAARVAEMSEPRPEPGQAVRHDRCHPCTS